MEFGYLDRQFSWGIDYESEFKDGHIEKLIHFLEEMVADAEKNRTVGVLILGKKISGRLPHLLKKMRRSYR